MKKAKIQLLIGLFVFCFLTIICCKRTVNCAAFSSGDLKYLPYSANDSITFQNDSGGTYTIVCKSVVPSSAFSIDCKGASKEKSCPCISNVQVIALDSFVSGSYPFLTIEQSDVSEMQYYKYRFRGFYLEFDFINELPHINDFDNIDLVGDLTVGDTVFSNVILYTGHQNGSEVTAIFLSQYNGILKYVEAGKEWQIVH